MKQSVGDFGARVGDRMRRAWGAIRRHPLRAALALPALMLLYVLTLYAFTPSIGDIRKSREEYPSVVMSSDGKELAVFKRANRDWVKLADISPLAIQALLATEDHRFYDHHGIDFSRTVSAVLNTLQGDTQGGSTLTQQLARNLYPEEIGREQTVTRKIKEAITALKIEAIYSKDEILESYLNSVSFLYNAWGIESAARTYFDKPSKNLNELEAATLVGMLKGTSYYNPVLNPERALQRRNTVLSQMVKHGKLGADKYDRLKAQPMKLDFARLPEFNGAAPHVAEHLRRWLFEWADKHDYNIYGDGLVVKTTIDSRMQAMANEAVKRQGDALQAVADVEWSRSATPTFGTDPQAYLAQRNKAQAFDHFWTTNKPLVTAWVKDSTEFKQAREQGLKEDEALEQLRANNDFMANLRKQKTMLQAGFLAIEPTTGHIKAWVGSRDYNEDKFDHVQQARRQPGSTFKPFVYGAAFEMGIPPNETLVDGPVAIQIDKNQVWRPGDVGGAPTNAPMTLREGLARSKNTITAQLMMRVGPDRVAALAKAMGVRQSKLAAVPSLALGTSPVTLKEMVASFSTIANGGNYIEPVLVTAIEDRQKNVLQTFHAQAAEPALSNQAAMTLLDVLRGTIDQGTAVGLKPRFKLTGDLAGKTGTTQDNTDGWFILMHPNLVAGAWMGFNDNRVTMRSEYWGQGSHNALLVVGDFMQQTTRASLVNQAATFAAPRQQDLEQPLLQRMGDWWNSVFNMPPSAADPQSVAMPPVRLDPPVLEPAPRSLDLPSAMPPVAISPPVSPDAPVIVQPLGDRMPAFPRPLDGGRAAETVTGTQVYRSPEASFPRPGDSGMGAVVRPVQPMDTGRSTSTQGSATTRVFTVPSGSGGGTSSMGAPSIPGGSSGMSSPPPTSAPAEATGSPSGTE